MVPSSFGRFIEWLRMRLLLSACSFCFPMVQVSHLVRMRNNKCLLTCHLFSMIRTFCFEGKTLFRQDSSPGQDPGTG
ncbi:hypothetical protein BDD12DRAFT_53742 [Trichophaea hybrida]|nr:hypothetical protein BDD12DRAFT_53742 [Trichophaea hybrida]